MAGRRREKSWREESGNYQAVDGVGRRGSDCQGNRLENGSERILRGGRNGGEADGARSWEREAFGQVEAVTERSWDRGVGLA